jgi:hypothetical protein
MGFTSPILESERDTYLSILLLSESRNRKERPTDTDTLGAKMRDFRGSSLTTSRSEDGLCPGTLAQCHHCGYTWCYRGRAKRATCPNCGLKTPVLSPAELAAEKLNRLFEELERMRPHFLRELEVFRVILIKIVKENELKESLVKSLCSGFIQTRLEKEERVRGPARNW